MVKKILLGILIFVSSGSLVQAGVEDVIKLENEIQKKVDSLIRPIDPYAQSAVQVRYKKVKTKLPGILNGKTKKVITPESKNKVDKVVERKIKIQTALPGLGSFNNDESDSELPDEVVETEQGEKEIETPKPPVFQKVSVKTEKLYRIDITIRTSLDEFPEGLKQFVKRSVRFKGVRTRLRVSKIDPESLSMLRERVKAERPESFPAPIISLAEKMQEFAPQLFYIVLAFLGFLFLFQGIVPLFRDQRLVRSIREVGAGLSSAATVGGESQAIPRESFESVSNIPPAVPKDSTTSSELSRLSVQSLLAVLSDAYWCREDAYASWIWAGLNSEQKTEILKKTKVPNSYFGYIFQLAPERKSFHEHPYYLTPFEMDRVGQAELEAWARKHPEHWAKISPLRKAHFKMTLEETLKLHQSQQSGAQPSLPTTVGEGRVVLEPLSVQTLSESDEELVLRNPALVHPDLRAGIRSLVWTALLQTDRASEILALFSALDLARVWSGSKRVLERLKQALPEKKYDMIVSYQNRVPIQHDSEVMKQLVARSVRALNDEAFVKKEQEKNQKGRPSDKKAA